MNPDDSLIDRRQRGFKTLLYTFFMKRRKVSHANHYVDVHEPKLFYVIVGVLLLCAADAYMTTLIIGNGGSELNPFMDVLIKSDISLFFYVKYFVTAIGVLFFLVHKNFIFFRSFTGYHLIFTFLFIYAVLIGYEVYLISMIPGLLFS